MTQAQDDVIALVLEDHRQIKSMMNDLSAARGDVDELFERLIAKLAMHETAEEEVVHPLARRRPGGEAIVEAILRQEDRGKKALAELEEMGPANPGFKSKFELVKAEVLAHAWYEELREHPKLHSDVDLDQREKAATVFRIAERIGPTHAHKHSPESATGNIFVGTFVAVADRVRDAIRSATPSSAR
jgi:hypothetical protein